MIVDVYDTYATAPTGVILHFEAILPAGATQAEASQRIHDYVGGSDPEVEMEWTSRRLCSDAEVLRELRRCGLCTVSLNPLRAAG